MFDELSGILMNISMYPYITIFTLKTQITVIYRNYCEIVVFYVIMVITNFSITSWIFFLFEKKKKFEIRRGIVRIDYGRITVITVNFQ